MSDTKQELLEQSNVFFYFVLFCFWFRASYINMHKYFRDATVSWLLFKELYMFRAFTMPIIRSIITAQAAVGIIDE
jgi:hypothetical protein